ncbi:MAG: acetyltransferase [Syntrophomonadaceae bacterium]|nr:acetyltransferase [Syntrophomonadaceae bacterium]
MKKPLIIIGGGGHSRVLLDILLSKSYPIIAIAEVNPNKKLIRNVPVLDNDDWILRYDPESVNLVNGIGMIPGGTKRYQIYQRFKNRGYCFENIMHPSAMTASDIKLAEGVQIMAGAIVQSGVVINENSIINTGSIIDHDAFIGRHVHVAPGATICGNVAIGAGTFVGAGATIIHGVQIAAACVIGAGSAVTRNVPAGATVVGIPARIVKINEHGIADYL